MKTCRICNQDCSSKPRVRDPEGNYYCRACLEERKAEQAAAAAAQGALDPFEAGALAADEGYELADLMGDVGPGAGATACPQCGNEMRAGSALCVHCGYDPAKGKSLRTAVSVEREPKEPRAPRMGAGTSLLSGLFDESPILPIVSVLAHGTLFVLAMDNEEMAMLYFGVAGLVWTGVLLWGLVLMFMDSVVHALGGFVCWFYWLYWVVMESDNRALQLLTLVSVLSLLTGRLVLGFPEANG
jgi:hypothetical protein